MGHPVIWLTLFLEWAYCNYEQYTDKTRSSGVVGGRPGRGAGGVVRSDANGPRFEAKPCAASGASGARVGVRAWLLHQSETDESFVRPDPLQTVGQRVGAASYFMPVSFA